MVASVPSAASTAGITPRLSTTDASASSRARATGGRPRAVTALASTRGRLPAPAIRPIASRPGEAVSLLIALFGPADNPALLAAADELDHLDHIGIGSQLGLHAA